MKQSLKYKFIFFIALFIALTITIQGFSNVLFAKQYSIYKKTHEMYAMFESLKVNIAYHDEIENAMLHYVEDENIHIFVTNQNNTVIYSSNHTSLVDYTKLDARFDKTPQVKRAINQRTQKESLTLFGLITKSQETYYVLLDTPISALERSVAVVNELNMMIAIVSLALGILITWFWSNRLLVPLKHIDEVAQNVANLDFSKKLDPPFSKDEIGRLSKNINLMSDQLSSMISSLRAANHQLEEDVITVKKLNSMQREFIGNVSHELKSPLGLLVLYCENLKNDLPGIDHDFYYDVIIEESHRLSKLVNQLLNLSVIESGLAETHKTAINFSQFARWVCDKKSVLFESRGIQLLLKFDDDLFVNGDEFYMEQAITNLLDNALRHSYKQSATTVSAYKNEGYMCFSVYNQGEIIAEEEFEQLWNNFYKVDKSHTPTSDNNVGLGLSIVSGVVRDHGGQYGLIAQPDGMEFWFKLPIIIKE